MYSTNHTKFELDWIKIHPNIQTSNFSNCLMLQWPGNVVKIIESGVNGQSSMCITTREHWKWCEWAELNVYYHQRALKVVWMGRAQCVLPSCSTGSGVNGQSSMCITIMQSLTSESIESGVNVQSSMCMTIRQQWKWCEWAELNAYNHQTALEVVWMGRAQCVLPSRKVWHQRALKVVWMGRAQCVLSPCKVWQQRALKVIWMGNHNTSFLCEPKTGILTKRCAHMRLCVCVCVCVCVWVHAWDSVYLCPDVTVSVCKFCVFVSYRYSTGLCTHTHTHMHQNTYTHTHTHTHLHSTFEHIYTLTQVYTLTYTCTRTQTHAI